MSSSNCCFLTCIQISQEAGKVVWYSHLLKNFPQFIAIHTVKGFGIVNEAEVDVFLEFSSFFNDLEDVGNLISGSSAFSKSSWNIGKFRIRVLKAWLGEFFWSLAWRILSITFEHFEAWLGELFEAWLGEFEHYFASMWDECNCAIVWTFFGIAFLWDSNENWPFPVLWPLLSFPNLLAYWVQRFHSIIF